MLLSVEISTGQQNLTRHSNSSMCAYSYKYNHELRNLASNVSKQYNEKVKKQQSEVIITNVVATNDNHSAEHLKCGLHPQN